jgi:altronate dehydratase small subunit
MFHTHRSFALIPERDEHGWDAVRIAPGDHVAVALRDLIGRIRVCLGDEIVEMDLSEAIPLGHKFALSDLPAGMEILKYGAPIGRLSRPVMQGAHIHVHNLESQRAGH